MWTWIKIEQVFIDKNEFENIVYKMSSILLCPPNDNLTSLTGTKARWPESARGYGDGPIVQTASGSF